MSETIELFEKVNLYQETQRAEVDMAMVRALSLCLPMAGGCGWTDALLCHHHQEGLGRLPEYIPSVGSVLLFNSGENPYQKVESKPQLYQSALSLTRMAGVVHLVG